MFSLVLAFFFETAEIKISLLAIVKAKLQCCNQHPIVPGMALYILPNFLLSYLSFCSMNIVMVALELLIVPLVLLFCRFTFVNCMHFIVPKLLIF